MSVDFNAIAVALAVRFSSTNVTPPSGSVNIRESTSELPGQIKVEPTVLIFPPGPGDSEFSFHASLRSGVINFPVRFYLWRIRDEKRNSVLVLKWLSALYAQLDGKVQLGEGGYLSYAVIRNIGAATLGYGGENYEGVVMDAEVHIAEGMAPVA